MLTMGVVATLLCSQKMLDMRPNIETGPIFFGLIFPIVFLINQNWRRREQGAERIALLRANSIQLILKVLTGSGVKDPSPTKATKIIDLVENFFTEVARFLPQDSVLAGPRLARIYRHVAALQEHPECQLLTRFMLSEFEKLSVLRDY